MTAKPRALLVVSALLAVAAYWYWSPFVALHLMRNAAQSKDADAFNEYVDYPRLRESLKSQFSALMTEAIGATSKSGSGMEQAGRALGSLMGLAMVDRMVDALVRPEAVMRAMQEATVAPLKTEPTSAGEPGEAAARRIVWSHERKGANKLVAYVKEASELEDRRVGLVFERAGFAAWRLTEIRLPALSR